ncbi:uncharacterized protein [Eurosta solidaginis]|uniref:uncharacterized protein n=1 Tax=Eurosta solidaginis TaxID=178769 RepID=UPI0035310844
MSFFVNLTKTLISSFRSTNLTTQITAKIFEIVRGQSTRALCKRVSRPDLRGMVIKFGRIRCPTPPPTCGITRKPSDDCKPKIEITEEWKKCCMTECQWQHPRFDDLYYKPSDKLNRTYKQTWVECGDIHMYPARICCYEKQKYPLPERRKPPKPVALCNNIKYCKLQMLCRNRLESKCAKLTWAGCRKVRDPPKCGLERAHCGIRPKTPYPSFSECRKDIRRIKKTKQCDCLAIALACNYKA